MLDAPRLQNDVDTASDDVLGPLQCRPGRELNHVDEVTLILLGDEAGRRLRELDTGNADQPCIDHEHDDGSAHEATGQVPVTGREPFDAAIEATESPVQQAS